MVMNMMGATSEFLAFVCFVLTLTTSWYITLAQKSRQTRSVTRTKYLNDSGVKLYASAVNQKSQSHEILLICTNRSERINLLLIHFGALVHTLHVRDCNLENITKLAAFHLISQDVSKLYVQNSEVSMSTESLRVFQQTMTSLSISNCTSAGYMEFPPMAALTSLILSGLSLTQLPGGLHLQKQLIYLDLSRNSFSKAVSGNWDNLQHLTLSENSFTGGLDLGELLDSAISLAQLHLRHNSITSLKLSPRPLQKLKVLDLSHNSVESLEWIIDLSHNEISHITEEALRAFSNMIKVDLSHNKLTSLDKPLHGMSLPLTVLLGGNEWRCDCHLSWLHLSREFSLQPLPFCHEPSNYRKFTINNFPGPRQCDEDENGS